jgi:aerobic carbon-monoxide dehydrogenase large subunit
MDKASARLEVTAFMVLAFCQPPQNSAAAAAGCERNDQGCPIVSVAIDGDWKMVLSTLTGTREMTGHFDSDGSALSGYLSSPEGRTAFTGTIEGNRLRFDVHVVQPVKITLKYDLEVEGNRLVGKVKIGIFGTGKVEGERTN